MVCTPKSSNHNSPTSAPSSAPSGDSNSPNFPRKNLPSPWAQVVRGGEPESTAGIHQSPPSSSSSSSSLAAEQAAAVSDCSPTAVPASPPVENSITVGVVDSCDGSEGNAGGCKKPVWKMPSNGVVEAGPVMGAESWPALSESTKGSAKVSAESSSKPVTDGSLSTSQGPITSQPPRKQASANLKPNSASSYNMPNRQRSIKRMGGSSTGSGPVQRNLSSPPPPPPPPPFPVYQLPLGSYGMVPGIPEPAPRDHYHNNNWDPRPIIGGFVPPMNDVRVSSRRGYFGSHPREGSYHNNYGSRRDHDRGHYVNTRDGHVPQPRMPHRGLLRHPPPSTASFVGTQPIAPFANPIGYSEFYYIPTAPTVAMEPFRGMSIFASNHPPPAFFPAVESSLSHMIVNQIEYYFSDANLVSDDFLRSNMDEQGWVPITLIANFPRVRSLTSNIQYILESLRSSTFVEVQADKLRRHGEWMYWLPSSQLPDSGSTTPGGSRYSNLATDFQTITLEKETTESSGQSLSNDVDTAGRST